MADSTGSENWLGNWFQSVKEKTAVVYEQVKKDINEYTNTVQNDTLDVISHTSGTLSKTLQDEKSTLKKSVTNLIGGFHFNPLSRDHNDPELNKTSSIQYDRSKMRLRAIQLDPDTYLLEPSGDPADYKSWVDTFDLDNHKAGISELLVTNPEMRSIYTQLVPSNVSHVLFWSRYFYRLHQLQCDEDRKMALMKRAEQICDDQYTWDEDDDETEPFTNITEEIVEDQSKYDDNKIQSAKNNVFKIPVVQNTEENTEHTKCDLTLSPDLSFPVSTTDTHVTWTSPPTTEQNLESRVISTGVCDVTDTLISASEPITSCDLATRMSDDKHHNSSDHGESSDSFSSDFVGIDIKDVEDDWEVDVSEEISAEQLKAAEQMAKILHTSDNPNIGDEDIDDWS